MKLLKVMLSMGISSCFAQTDLLRNSVSTAAGKVDYAMTYDPSVLGAGTTTVSTPVLDTSASDSVIKEFISGISIDKAQRIDSYLIAASAGGDFARTGLDVAGTESATGGDASVKNYAIYGYVTPNFAYAGQYADQIKGEGIDMESASSNMIDVDAIPAIALANTRADGILGSTANNYADSYTNLITNQFTRDIPNQVGTSDFTVSKVYQYAQAGGSATPSDYPMGLWAQAENDKGFTFIQKASDTITENTGDYYQATATRNISQIQHLR